ncbi:C4-dicarboxylate ABC transporter [Brevundimonas sp. S30B]|nr:C4-dicarboxylate ABC transporter [Brevundimonas sp. MF30-B]TFW04661.1 C4-dicarboxylate ABC transporter [Brevundimonas sp. S30B]
MAAILAILIVLASLLYLNRRAAARELLVGWLEQRGIDAEVDVEAVNLNRFVARVRIGDADDPDFTVERVEIDYAVAGPWSARGAGVTPSRIRLIRPILRATWAQDRFSLGSLDPLIEEFRSRPPNPDSAPPEVIVETGRLRLLTEYGPYPVLADARLVDGRLVALTARAPAAALRSGRIEARGLAWRLDATGQGDALSFDLTAEAGRARIGDSAVTGARMSLDGALPYPDPEVARIGGAARVAAAGQAEEVRLGAMSATGVELTAEFEGRVRGWLEAFDLGGRVGMNLEARRLSGPSALGHALSLTMTEAELEVRRPRNSAARWSVAGPARVNAGRLSADGLRGEAVTLSTPGLDAGGQGRAFEVEAPLQASAGRLTWSDIQLRQVQASTAFNLSHAGATLITATGRASAARAEWPLFGAPAGDDVPELAQMKRALSNFALDAPGFTFTTGSPGTTLALTRPLTARPLNGGVLTVSAANRHLYSAEPGRAGGGALRLAATRGQGLPALDMTVPDWRLTPSGFEARLTGRAGLDFGLARQIDLTTAGLLASSAGRLTYTAQDCTPLTVARLELEENSVTGISGRLCPTDAPLVLVEGGRWTARGRFEGVAAEAPFLQMQFADAQGPLRVDGGPSGLLLTAGVEAASVTDAAEPVRFRRLSARGRAGLSNEVWSGDFALSRGDFALGQVMLTHDGRAQAGGVTIDTGLLTFAEGGLQPNLLSPLVEDYVQNPVTGSARFQGRFDWSATSEVGTSSGRLTIPSLDFVSPAGPVEGLSGDIAFNSLAPLQAAPGQRLTVRSLNAFADLSDLELVFGLDTAALLVDGAAVRVGGGWARLEPLSIPLDPKAATTGVLVLENVQIGDLISGAGFAEQVRMDAMVSGRLPFTWDAANGARVSGGQLTATRPGRLSIQREALSDLEAGGAGEDVAPNTVQDLAYQAMENLAFDLLTAEVNSLDGGRLNLLFHIKGRHDPPQRQELRLSLRELITRDFLKRELPLPSDTGIDLTLDTTLNVNQLISDLIAYQRARAGELEPTP